MQSIRWQFADSVNLLIIRFILRAVVDSASPVTLPPRPATGDESLALFKKKSR